MNQIKKKGYLYKCNIVQFVVWIEIGVYVKGKDVDDLFVRFLNSKRSLSSFYF